MITIFDDWLLDMWVWAEATGLVDEAQSLETLTAEELQQLIHEYYNGR